MHRIICLLLLVWPLVACNDVVDFLNNRPPCRADCLKKPGFQNCQNCKCQPGQETIPEHVCCQGGACVKPPAQLDPSCMNPADGNIYLAVEQPQAAPPLPLACTPFNIFWAYKNTSQGPLSPPAAHGRPDPVLNIHEVQGASPDILFPAAWGNLETCQTEQKFAHLPEGLVPTTSSTGTYSVQVQRLPTNTIGTDTMGMRVESVGSPCPPP